MNRMIEAYQKIVAPEGLKERIEGQIMQDGQIDVPKRKAQWLGSGWQRASAIALMTACLFAAVVGVGKWYRGHEGENLPGICLAMEEGEILGARHLPVHLVSEQTEHVSAISWLTESTKAAVFQVTSEQPVTFRAEIDCLSVYDEEKKRWTDCKNELMIESDGILCLLFPTMGEDDVFYIQMSSAGKESRIEIVYDETAAEYKAAYRTKLSE
ncbi:MAG: hypothetical protein IJN46_08710 [Lachnospiraceae bacterium]|nr:hypothetical protein [Lachnospiraceae bacterium]